MSASIDELVNSEGLQGILNKFRQYLMPNDQNIVLRYTNSPTEVATQMSGRQELVAKLVSTCLGLAVSFTITYFGFKYLAIVLDPTRQEK